jgi:plastocyanin
MGRLVAAFIAVVALASCNEPAFPPGGAQGAVIVIASLAFTPASVTVPPGATIEVVNQDAVPHSVTSEAAVGAFAAGAVAGVSFDTGPFTAGTRFITIPADAPDGTVISFFCTVHGAGDAPPEGNVTVSRAAAGR